MNPDDLAMSWQTYFTQAGIRVAVGLLILAVGWLLSKWARSGVLAAARKAKLDEALGRFLATISRYIVVITAVLAALGHMGIETSSLLAVFASAGLAVGLALQGSLSNFASGVMILIFRPFRIDDTVILAGNVGKVLDIGMFATTLLTPDGLKVFVPNSKVTGDVVTNITDHGTRRADVAIGVAYGEDVAKVRTALLRAVSSVAYVLPDPAPQILFLGFGASSLDFAVRVWSSTSDFMLMQDALRDAIYRELDAEGIEIPFAQVVVHQASVDAAA